MRVLILLAILCIAVFHLMSCDMSLLKRMDKGLEGIIEKDFDLAKRHRKLRLPALRKAMYLCTLQAKKFITNVREILNTTDAFYYSIGCFDKQYEKIEHYYETFPKHVKLLSNHIFKVLDVIEEYYAKDPKHSDQIEHDIVGPVTELQEVVEHLTKLAGVSLYSDVRQILKKHKLTIDELKTDGKGNCLSKRNSKEQEKIHEEVKELVDMFKTEFEKVNKIDEIDTKMTDELKKIKEKYKML